MSTSSFKETQIRPARYRTPSPPREAVEPITPSAIEHAPNLGAPALARGGVEEPQEKGISSGLTGPIEQRDDQDTMNAFALIALATSPPAPSHAMSQQENRTTTQTAVDSGHHDTHVSKRAKSEKLRSPEWHRIKQGTEPRPTTSYHVHVQSSTSDAELLLNFSQVARSSHVRHSLHRHTKSDQTNTMSSSPQKSAHGATVDHTFARPQDQKIPFETVQIHDTRATGRGEDGGVTTNIANKQQGDKAMNQDVSKGDILPDQAQSESSLEEPITKEPLPNLHSSLRIAASSSPAPGLAHRAQMSAASPTKNEIKDIESAPRLASGYSAEKIPILRSIDKLGSEQSTANEPSDVREVVSLQQTVANDELESQSSSQVPADAKAATSNSSTAGSAEQSLPLKRAAAPSSVCAACNFSRNSSSMDNEYNATSWISCDVCKSWFHFACAGFRNEREVRGVDKFRCKNCKPIHGSTTFVRKSARAHTAIDYAGLNEGVVKTSDERPEHHYIKPIKDGTITFLPESFPRMPPGLVTAEFLERSYGWKEPIVVPAALNPRPQPLDVAMRTSYLDNLIDPSDDPTADNVPSDDLSFSDNEYEAVPEHEQDALDMVMPRNLTVRQVAELYGPEEKVEVIDVKSQNGETKKWNMRRWADYYESSGSKIVRNVISLEVSQSKLGRLIRRPQVVRDLDLQDSVWPAELQAKREIPRVQFYCLMSVADCFTDFHIDFGGSSVFYHIIRGKKTFLFIPPKEKHLKKYEEWCKSPAQNWTFLADQTKECYRVDLSPGDTMLIPAGWIHAVWTPEDSLVIGGNFLTRMNYGMQFKIAQLEKATGVARKFRYPHFQKLHWYAALKYLVEDPLPDSVKILLQEGGVFHRPSPAHHDLDIWVGDASARPEDYHARYYSQSELEGLPELIRYLLRTALIDNGSITDGITQETRNTVKKSIPRGHGEPLDVVKNFASWCAWKRGNEEIPAWAYPGAMPDVPEAPGKLSAAAQKRMGKEAALQAPRRQSARKQLQQHVTRSESPALQGVVSGMTHEKVDNVLTNSMLPSDQPITPVRRKVSAFGENGVDYMDFDRSSKKPRTSSGVSSGSRRKIACDTCRQRRRACKHKIIVGTGISSQENDDVAADTGNAKLHKHSHNDDFPSVRSHCEQTECESDSDASSKRGGAEKHPNTTYAASAKVMDAPSPRNPSPRPSTPQPEKSTDQPSQPRDDNLHQQSASAVSKAEITVGTLTTLDITSPTSILYQNRGRTKACAECRKSKVSVTILHFHCCNPAAELWADYQWLQRRCVHDELGNEDPVKAKEAATPRPAAALKRKLAKEISQNTPAKRRQTGEDRDKMQVIETKPAPLSPPVPPDTRMEPIGSARTMDDHLSAPSPMPTPSGMSGEQQPVSEPALASIPVEFIEFAERPVSAENANGDTNRVSYSGAAIPSPLAESEELPVSIAAEAELTDRSASSETQPLGTTILQSSNPPLKLDTGLGYPSNPMSATGLSTTGAAAHSLASPPPSSNSPSAQNGASPSEPSSRHSSRHPKMVERYSPSSGSGRRTSNSSVGGVGGTRGTASKSTSPLTSVATDEELDQERREEVGTRSNKLKTPITPKIIKEMQPKSDQADEETMRLIQELQAQEHGLRRRGRA